MFILSSIGGVFPYLLALSFALVWGGRSGYDSWHSHHGEQSVERIVSSFTPHSPTLKSENLKITHRDFQKYTCQLEKNLILVTDALLDLDILLCFGYLDPCDYVFDFQSPSLRAPPALIFTV